MICEVCNYPSYGETCENPGCPQDKGDSQLALIKAAQAEYRKRAVYAKRGKIDYSLSFKKSKGRVRDESQGL